MYGSIIFAALSVFSLPALVTAMPSDKQLDALTYAGRGTWYNDGLGACGDWNKDSDTIVALSPSVYGAPYGPGPHCNQWVHITNTQNGKKAFGMVRDKCPGCGANDLDMSIGLFEQIGALDTGVLHISWNFMPKGWSPA